MEILVVVSIMAILMGIAIPAAKSLMASFESGTGVRQLINAALSSARAIAVREQTYAGVRFQQDKDGHTYIVLIEHDPDPSPNGTGLANGFRAVTGRKPMKLPEETTLNGVSKLTGPSVVFSPQGKLTIHPVRTSTQDGTAGNDTIFNTQANVDAGIAMLVQDSSDFNSTQSITIQRKGKDGVVIESNREYISPYTGELVMEYREQKP